jgi:hypothetical protein
MRLYQAVTLTLIRGKGNHLQGFSSKKSIAKAFSDNPQSRNGSQSGQRREANCH